MPDRMDLLTKANRHHQAGHFAEAERLYRLIMIQDPGQAEALHFLGVLAHQAGRNDVAVTLLAKAIGQKGGIPAFHSNLAIALQHQGRLDQAAASYRRALAQQPDYADAYGNLGLVLQDQGKLVEAMETYGRALAHRPTYAEAHHNLGTAFQEQGKPDEAIVSLAQALNHRPDLTEAHYHLGIALMAQGRLDKATLSLIRALLHRPDYAEALNNLGTAFQEQGKPDKAIIAFARALSIRPELAEADYNLGIALRAQGRLDDAALANRRALVHRPDYAEAHNNLGITLQEQGEPAAAAACYRRALTQVRDYAEAHNNLGIARQEQGKLDQAMTCYRRALVHRPDYARAYYNLGVAFQEQGKADAAVVFFERALIHRPDYAQALSYLVFQLMHLCDWRGLAKKQEQVLDVVRRRQGGITPFSLLVLPSGLADQLACATIFAGKYRVPASNLLSRTDPPGDRIRIGYLSSDYRDHATAYLIAELIERHDRHRFKISGYSLGPDSDGVMRRRLIAGFDRFVDLSGLPLRDAAERIHRNGIDILVDLKGYTQDAKTRILAFRPAPVQVNFLGYPGTMGAGFIDYIIADRFCIPPGQDMFYSEKVVRLPDCYQPNDSRRTIAMSTPTRGELGLPELGFVFCCFNNSFKLTPGFFQVWMRLLAAVPGSVLWLLQANDAVKANLRREAAFRGIDPDRLVFAPRQALPDHLARHRRADLFLDTLPYNAHTTASDALWAGLPVLTCTGQTFAGRVAAGLLSAAQLPELITGTVAEYEAKALTLATQPAHLAAIREKLRNNRDTAPLFDCRRFTRNIETAYARMWGRWCDGHPAAAFDVV